MRQSAHKRQPTYRRPSANKNLMTNDQVTTTNRQPGVSWNAEWGVEWDEEHDLPASFVKDLLKCKEDEVFTPYEFG